MFLHEFRELFGSVDVFVDAGIGHRHGKDPRGIALDDNIQPLIVPQLEDFLKEVTCKENRMSRPIRKNWKNDATRLNVRRKGSNCSRVDERMIDEKDSHAMNLRR